MRVLALAAVCGALLVGGVAAAEPWNDPNGRLTFEQPAGWSTLARRAEGFTYVISGTANNECHIIAQPNDSTAQHSAAALRTTAANDAQFTAEMWTRVANSMLEIFPNDSATFVSRSTDSSGFWPIQRAELRSPERDVHAAIQLRPGVDYTIYCLTFGGADRTDLYDAVIRSVGHPNDAAWRTQIEAAAQAQ